MVKTKCLNCGIDFSIYHYEIGRAKFHNRDCASEYKRGKHASPKTEFKKGDKCYWKGKKNPKVTKWLSPHQFKKGFTPWNKGKHTGIKPWLGKKRPSMYEDKNKAWKGEDVGYTALHDWVNDRLPNPGKCSHCGSRKHIQLSNISGEYKRDLVDWQWLCAKCHYHYDRD
jgi:hypothetical protein